MALNLIKVTDKKIGTVYIGVAHIVAVKPAEIGCVIFLSTDAAEQGAAISETAAQVAELCNRRPPDGN